MPRCANLKQKVPEIDVGVSDFLRVPSVLAFFGIVPKVLETEAIPLILNVFVLFHGTLQPPDPFGKIIAAGLTSRAKSQ